MRWKKWESQLAAGLELAKLEKKQEHGKDFWKKEIHADCLRYAPLLPDPDLLIFASALPMLPPRCSRIGRSAPSTWLLRTASRMAG